MQTIIVTLFCLLFSIMICDAADVRVFGYSSADQTSWKDIDPTFGVAWYTDVDFYKNLPDDRNDYLAFYAQIPMVEYDDARLTFGVIAPPNSDRIRPTLGVSYIVGDAIHAIPDWLPLEVGAYVSLGSYKGYGLQFGLLRLKF